MSMLPAILAMAYYIVDRLSDDGEPDCSAETVAIVDTLGACHLLKISVSEISQGMYIPLCMRKLSSRCCCMARGTTPH